MFIITNYIDKDQDNDVSANYNEKAWQSLASVQSEVAGQMHLFEFVPASVADAQPSEGRSIYRSAYLDIRLRQKKQEMEMGSNYSQCTKQH